VLHFPVSGTPKHWQSLSPPLDRKFTHPCRGRCLSLACSERLFICPLPCSITAERLLYGSTSVSEVTSLEFVTVHLNGQARHKLKAANPLHGARKTLAYNIISAILPIVTVASAVLVGRHIRVASYFVLLITYSMYNARPPQVNKNL
jgi:hypothetical protein